MSLIPGRTPRPVVERRRAIADLFDTLTPAQQAAPSLCEAWTCAQVVAHLLMEPSVPKRTFRRLIAVRDYHEVARDWAIQTAQEMPDIGDRLRAASTGPIAAPLGAAGALAHLVVHEQDIRRPLGLVEPVPAALAVPTLDALTSPRHTSPAARARIAGLRLHADDVDWSSGDAADPIVRGPAAALISALANRPAALADLSGDGAELFGSRF